MIVAGVGFTSAASGAEILRAILAALQRHDLSTDALALLASIEDKRDSAAIGAAADQLGIPLIFIKRARLKAASHDLPTSSKLSIIATGVPSVSEAAAVAAAGRNGSLLGDRLITGPVTCALAQSATEQATLFNSPER